MPGRRYTDASDEARSCGLDLLELTRGYENLVVPRGLGPTPLAVLALVARARHLLRQAYLLADAGDSMSASILMRGITESVLTLAWLNKDPELASLVWMLDEIRTRLNQHEDVARLVRNERQRARRRGEPVAPLAPGQSHGVLTRPNVGVLRQLQERTRSAARRLPRYKARLETLKVKQVTRMPGFDERAQVAGAAMIYALTYRFDSNSAAHPNPLALDQFLEPRNGDVLIRATPKGPRPDPYAVGAVLLIALVDLGGEQVDHSQLEPGLAQIRDRLQALPR